MPVMYLLMGPQAGGKTHWRKTNCPHLPVISSDEVFEVDSEGRRFWIDESGKKVYWSERLPLHVRAMAWKQVWTAFAEHLKEGKDFVFEGTFPRRIDRSPIINISKAFGYEVFCVYATASLKECLERNSQRPDPVPEAAMARTWVAVEPPTEEEGWSGVIMA
jgi:predicted kinase